MEKMTIRFWDRVNEEYRGDKDYLLNEYMGVYTEEFDYTAYLKKHDFIEPHFYINGKRVA